MYALCEVALLLINPVKFVYGTIPPILHLKTKEKTIDNLIFRYLCRITVYSVLEISESRHE